MEELMLADWLTGVLLCLLWCYGVLKLSDWMDRKETGRPGRRP